MSNRSWGGWSTSGVIAEPQFARLASILAGGDANGADFVIPLETLDDRAFEITVHRMTSEGTVLVIQDVTERRNAQFEINRMARFDSVTELPNRRCFEEQLALALRRDGGTGDGLTVMFLDLDDFKQVNDSLGHRTGDKLLVEIARRLSAIIGPRDLVARWGGDEFVILHHHAPGQLETPVLAKRIIDEINRAVVIDGSEVIVGASIGSASAPQDGTSPDALLSKADIALYAAKARRAAGVAGVRAGDGRQDPDSPADRARTARGGRHRRDRGLLPADRLASRPDRSSASRPWRAGAARCSAPCRRPNSSRSSRTSG